MTKAALMNLCGVTILGLGSIFLCIHAIAADECVQNDDFGSVQCTAPIIPEKYTYNYCTFSLLSTDGAAANSCTVRLGKINSEDDLINHLNCYQEWFGSPQRVGAINWQPAGATEYSMNCGTAKTIVKYGGVEIYGFEKLELFVGVFALRSRPPYCLPGWSEVTGSDNQIAYCRRMKAPICEKIGNPIQVGTGQKIQQETDIGIGTEYGLGLNRNYYSFGYYRPISNAVTLKRGFGDFWRHTYSGFLLPEVGNRLLATIITPSLGEKHFNLNGIELGGEGGPLGRLINTSSGWIHYASNNIVEQYHADGRLARLGSVAGYQKTTTYGANRLLEKVEDSFGRTLSFAYDSEGRLFSVIDSAGDRYEYAYDENDMLAQVKYPDGTMRRYEYNATGRYIADGGIHSLSYRYDELNSRVGTYTGGLAYQISPWFETEGPGGAGKFLRGTAGGDIYTPLGDSFGLGFCR